MDEKKSSVQRKATPTRNKKTIQIDKIPTEVQLAMERDAQKNRFVGVIAFSVINIILFGYIIYLTINVFVTLFSNI